MAQNCSAFVRFWGMWVCTTLSLTFWRVILMYTCGSIWHSKENSRVFISKETYLACTLDAASQLSRSTFVFFPGFITSGVVYSDRMKLLQVYIPEAASYVHHTMKSHSTMCTCNTNLTSNLIAFVMPKLCSWNHNQIWDQSAQRNQSDDIALSAAGPYMQQASTLA